jgi:hypothetical protein
MLDTLAPIIATQVAARDTRHVVFHGCIDWHPAVHGHWALLRIARTTGRHADKAEAVNRRMTAAGIAEEAALLRAHPRFEMPYGRAWFLLLAEEFERWATEQKLADPQRLRSMADEVATSLEDHFRPPVNANIGEYANPSWALLRLHAWHSFRQDQEAQGRIERLVASLRGLDQPADGFEADLQRPEFFSRLGNFALLTVKARPAGLSGLLKVHGRVDDALRPIEALPRSAHALGMNWSRAWAFKALAAAVPDAVDRQRFQAAYASHVAAAWRHHAQKAGDKWAYDHWVPQFAVYALTE